MTSTKEELTILYGQWMTAIMNNDLDALDRILGKEYVYTASGQGRSRRKMWMDAVPIYDIKGFELRQIDVRDYGDVAVALTEYRQEAVVAGKPRSGDFLITDTWVKRDGRWQVVARSSILKQEGEQSPFSELPATSLPG